MARDELFAANTGLVRALVRRYQGLAEAQDLFQLGAIGLLAAIDRFDPAYGAAFSTYAVPRILGEMRRYLRDNGPLKVERRMQELAGLAKTYRRTALRLSGNEPSVREIALALDVDEDCLLQALWATQKVLYLDKIPSDLDLAGDVDCEPARWAEKVDLKSAISNLGQPHKTVVWERYMLGKSQKEVAQSLGISQSGVSRLEKAALARLREDLAC